MGFTGLHSFAASIIASALLLVIVSGSMKARPAGYAGDLPYLNLLFAESISEYGIYGVHGDPKPAVHEAWWRRAGGVLSHHSSITPAAAYRILASVCAILVILVVATRLRVWYPQAPVATWLGALVLATSPPAALWILNGSSTALAALLVVAAVILHIRGLGDDQPLPFASAMCLGLAVCLRVEFVAVWLALWLHGIVIAFGPGRKDLSAIAVLIRGISGLVVFSIFAAPLVAWNMRLIQVPWPRYFDAPLALDMFSGSAGEAFSMVFVVMTDSISHAYRQWCDSLYVSGWIEKVLAIGGLFFWLIKSENEKRAPFAAMLIFLSTVPLFHALLVPFVGWSGATALYESLTPVWILALMAGVAAVYQLIDPLLIRVLPVFSNQTRHVIVFALIGLTPLLNGLFKNVHMIRADKESVLVAEKITSTLKDAIAADRLSVPVVASDQPGRLIHDWKARAIDLTAELDPEILAYLQNPGDLSDFLKEKNVHTVIIWDQRLADQFRDSEPVTPLFSPDEKPELFPFTARL